MKFKKSMLILITAIFLVSIVSVCASDANDTMVASEDANQIELSSNNELVEDNLKASEENNTLTQANDDESVSAKIDSEILTADEGTYRDVITEIGSGGDINLTKCYYTYTGGGTIVSTVPGIINSNGAVIDMNKSSIHAFKVNTSGATIKNQTLKNVKYTAAILRTGTITAKVENAVCSIDVDVIMYDPMLSVENSKVYYSENTTITLNYNSTATGKVNITLKGKKSNYTFTDMDLNNTIYLGRINLDEYDVTVTYSGDKLFFNTTANGNLTVFPIVDLSVNVTSDGDGYYYHDVVVWTITVKNAGNGTNATYVSVTDFIPTDKLEFIDCTVPEGTSYDNRTHVWTIGNMTNGTELTLTINSRAIVTGDIANAAHVDVKETDWNPDNNDDDYTVNVLPLIDVSVSITSDSDVYFADDIATWTIIVHNAANGTKATNVNLTEVFPDTFFELISCTTDNGTYYSNNGTWNIGFMGNGTYATLEITGRAKIAGNYIPNSVNCVASEKDWNLDNNDDENLVNIVVLPDIEMTVAYKEHYYYHDEVDYNIIITNRGITNYTKELTVSDSLPKGLEFVEVVNVTGADVVRFNESDLTWVLTNITPKTPAVITVRARIAEVDNLTNNVTITNPNGIEKKVGCTIESEPYVDISVVITSDKDDYLVDDIATWTIAVHNLPNGTDATDVRVDVFLPSQNFEIINYTTDNGTFDAGLWSIGFMANGTDAELTIVCQAKLAGENITSTVIADCNEADWNKLNNNANKTVNIPLQSSSVNVSDITLEYGVSAEVNVTTQGAKGITAKIDDDEAFVNNFTIIIPILDAGTYNLTVTTVPDENHYAVNKTVTITVNKVKSTLTVKEMTFDYGSSGSCEVTFANATGVNASVVNHPEAIVNVENNTITVSNLNAGTYTLTVTTIVDSNHNNMTKTATITVNRLKTELTANAITATYNVDEDLVITLKDSHGIPLSGVKITVDLNGARDYATDNNGQVKVSTKGLVPKKYAVKIAFNGNINYDESTKDVEVTVKKAKPVLTAKNKMYKTKVKTKKYTVTLKDNTGKPIKKAKVTLKVKGKTYKATTNSKGKATFKIKKLSKKGTFKAVIKYKGNKYYEKVTGKVKIKVIVTFKTVSKGCKDKSLVKDIQQALKDHGYYLTFKGKYLKVDGNYGSCTVRSIKEFQHDKGLKVTGKVDEKTAKKLGML